MRVDALWMSRRNVRKGEKKTWERRDRYKYRKDMGGSVCDGKMEKRVERRRGSVLCYVDQEISKGRVIKECRRTSEKETGPWILPGV